MRTLVLSAALVLSTGCGKPSAGGAPEEAQAHDVLEAYGKNPAAADERYKGKRLALYVPGVKLGRDGPATVAVYAPGYTGGARGQFYFVSEAEAAARKPAGPTYTITGRCEGLSGNVVVFRDCTAVLWVPPPKK